MTWINSTVFPMKKSVIAALHIGFWCCYLILIGVILGVIYGSRASVDEAKIEQTFVTLIFLALIPSAIAFYSYYFIIFRRFTQQKNVIFTVIIAIGFAFLGGLIGFASIYNLYGDNCLSGAENSDSDPIALTLFISMIALISGVIALMIKGFITWYEELKLKEELRKKNHAMELALVKAQLDPHFLFNTINNIDVLILKDASEASAYLNKLSDIMRFMLYETKAEKIPLTQEIEYIEKYIELQKIRTANVNYINYSKEGNPDEKIIAPMVFAPFIENAFKHTTNKKIDEAISIQLKIEEHQITFDCINKFDPNRKLQKEKNGLGNELIQKRLNLIYPNQHHLEMRHNNDTYSVHLSISYE